MRYISDDDFEYIVNQSSDRVNIILSGMTALMRDTDRIVDSIESQHWYQRMIKTVLGKNKASKAEIQSNHEKLNAYMSEAVAELYERGCLDSRVVISLGTQLNEICVEQVRTKQMMGAFVKKLNSKIESIDNYHLLEKEIEQGVYSEYKQLPAICVVLSQMDDRILRDNRKVNVLKRSLAGQSLLDDVPIQLSEYMHDLIDMPYELFGQVCLELGSLGENGIAKASFQLLMDYQSLTDATRKAKDIGSMIESVFHEICLDGSAKLTSKEIFEDFVSSKLNAIDGYAALFDTEHTESLPDKYDSAYGGNQKDVYKELIVEKTSLMNLFENDKTEDAGTSISYNVAQVYFAEFDTVDVGRKFYETPSFVVFFSNKGGCIKCIDKKTAGISKISVPVSEKMYNREQMCIHGDSLIYTDGNCLKQYSLSDGKDEIILEDNRLDRIHELMMIPGKGLLFTKENRTYLLKSDGTYSEAVSNFGKVYYNEKSYSFCEKSDPSSFDTSTGLYLMERDVSSNQETFASEMVESISEDCFPEVLFEGICKNRFFAIVCFDDKKTYLYCFDLDEKQPYSCKRINLHSRFIDENSIVQYKETVTYTDLDNKSSVICYDLNTMKKKTVLEKYGENNLEGLGIKDRLLFSHSSTPNWCAYEYERFGDWIGYKRADDLAIRIISV